MRWLFQGDGRCLQLSCARPEFELRKVDLAESIWKMHSVYSRHKGHSGTSRRTSRGTITWRSKGGSSTIRRLIT
eukprot:187272-Amphidinium_carterae.1